MISRLSGAFVSDEHRNGGRRDAMSRHDAELLPFRVAAPGRPNRKDCSATRPVFPKGEAYQGKIPRPSPAAWTLAASRNFA